MVMVPKIIKDAIPEGRTKEWLRDLWRLAKNNLAGPFQGTSMHFSLDGSDFTILFPGSSHYRRDIVWESHTVANGYFLNYTPREGSVFIDAGAFPGETAVIAARMVGPEGKVLAFEPDPVNREYLEEMLEANGVSAIVDVSGYALSGSRGDSLFSPRGDGGSRISDHGKIKVDTLGLDDVVSGLDRRKGLFVKMDIEGAELDVMRTAQDTLERGAYFAIAAYHIVGGRPTWMPLREIFTQSGYSVEVGMPEHPTLYASKQ